MADGVTGMPPFLGEFGGRHAVERLAPALEGGWQTARRLEHHVVLAGHVGASEIRPQNPRRKQVKESSHLQEQGHRPPTLTVG